MALTDNLVAYWRLDEASGNAIDQVGSNTLVDLNTVTSNPGKVGTARQFTRANGEALTIADNAALSAGASDISIACWIWLDSKTNLMTIISKNDGSTTAGSEYIIYYDNAADRLKFGLYGGAVLTLSGSSFGAVPTGQWIFVVGTFSFSTTNMRLYINGTLQPAGTFGSTPNNTTTQFQISGSPAATNYFDGRVDEVGIWKRELTSLEIATLYNFGAGLTYPFNPITPMILRLIEPPSVAIGPGTIDLANTAVAVAMYKSASMERAISQPASKFPGLNTYRLTDRAPGPLALSVNLALTGATIPLAVGTYNSIAQLLDIARFYARDNQGVGQVQLEYREAGGVVSTIFDVLDGIIEPMPDGGETAGKWIQNIKLTLFCQPFGRDKTATNMVSGTLANYAAALQGGGIGGTQAAPMRIRVQNKTGGTYDYIRVGYRAFLVSANFINPYLPGVGGTGYATVRGSGSAVSGNDIIYTITNQLSDAGFEGSWAAPTLGSELISNGTFAGSSSTGWALSAIQGGSTTPDPLDMATLPNSLGLTTVNPYAYYYQTVAVTAGKSYRLTVDMKNTTAQGAGAGASVTILGAGLSSTPDSLVANYGIGSLFPGTYGAVLTGHYPEPSKRLVEIGTSLTTHTWDFIAEKSFVQIWLRNDGSSEVFFDNVSLKSISAVAPGWTKQGTPGVYQAIDSEGEVAGSRVAEGSFAQGIGDGSAPGGSIIFHDVTTVSGGIYHIKARMRRTSGNGNLNIRAETYGGTNVTITTASPTFVTVEGLFTTTSLSTIMIWGDAGTSGIVDDISIIRDDVGFNELVRFTINANQKDNSGVFRVFARIKATTKNFILQTKHGGPLGQNITGPPTVITPSATFKMVDLGRISLPEYPVPNEVVLGNLAFGIWLDLADMGTITPGGSVEIAEVELIPIDEWYFEVEAPTGQGPALNEYLVVDSLSRMPVCYRADSSGNFLANLPFTGAWPFANSFDPARIYVHVARSRVSDNGSSDSFVIETLAYPCYDWLVG